MPADRNEVPELQHVAQQGFGEALRGRERRFRVGREVGIVRLSDAIGARDLVAQD